MKTHRSRKPDWPRKITLGRVSVTVYRRLTPTGNFAFMVAHYVPDETRPGKEKRRFDSYADESLALEAANKLARQLSEREVLAAAMTNEQAAEYAAAVQKLKPANVGLLSAAETVTEALKFVSDLPGIVAAAKFFNQRHRSVTAKRVAGTVAELLALKQACGKSPRYLRDLNCRLNRFAETFQKNIGDVTTPELQSWLDGMKLAPRPVKNFRAAIETLFSFAESRGYLAKGCNPVDDPE